LTASFFAVVCVPTWVKADAETRNEEIQKDGWNFGPLPCISYNSDLGFQYGICADIFNYKGVFPDYRQRFYVELSRYTKGQTLIHAQFDSRYLIPGIRTTLSASYQLDPMFLFFGLNGIEPYDRTLDCNKDIRTAYYNYRRSMFRVLTNFQGPVIPGLEWTAGVNYWHFVTSDLESDSYSAENTLFRKMKDAGVISPDESTGGPAIEFKVGAVLDTRDNLSAPGKGIWAELYFIGSPDIRKMGYDYLKICAHWRQYISLGSEKLVFAYHLAYQGNLAGKAPFYIQQNISTLYLNQTCTDGLGGMNTVRGLLAQRLVGDSYAWTNVELRIRLFSFNLFNQSWYLATNPFFDSGMVTSLYKGEELSSFYGRSVENLRSEAVVPHCSAGAGLKLAMNRNFIVSAEYARPFKKTDGDGTVYIALNYIF